MCSKPRAAKTRRVGAWAAHWLWGLLSATEVPDLEMDFDKWMIGCREHFQSEEALLVKHCSGSCCYSNFFLCNTGQGKAKDTEAGCKEPDITELLRWTRLAQRLEQKKCADKVGWKWIWDCVMVWGNPVWSLGVSKALVKTVTGRMKRLKPEPWFGFLFFYWHQSGH